MSSVIASIVLGLPFVQDAAKAKAPDAALFDELIRKTNELKAFVAEYKAHAPGKSEELSLRIVFRAPDAMKCEIPGMLMCARAGALEIRGSSSDGKSTWARAAVVERYAERSQSLAEAVCTEFPALKSTWKRDDSCGPTLLATISTTDGGKRDRFNFHVHYHCPKSALLDWLDNFKTWQDVTVEDEGRLRFRSPRGTELVLSTRTGFIESMHREDPEGMASLELVKLDLDPKLDDHSFDVPEPAAGAEDKSEDFSRQWEGTITFVERSQAFAWISARIASKELQWDADSRLRVGRIVQALHSDGITAESQPWIAETKKWIESTGAWMHERYASLAKTDEEARGELEAKAKEARDRLFESLQKLLKGRVSSLEIDATVVPDATLRSSLLELEQTSIEAAFEHSLQAPLLESFDDQVQRAKSGG